MKVAVIDLDLSKSQKDELLSKSRYGSWSIFNVKKYTSFGIVHSVLYILKLFGMKQVNLYQYQLTIQRKVYFILILQSYQEKE
ncbi:hypothetical protein BG262_01720 [Floricoccus penangensis]|uniref:Uncharacterized protein n=1 Tax=Floricoccus penangensis TaxID=1859475 RepID=A0A9Q5P036_9LACT|nr:hypothetical protein [Floricoccus penangensis]OFI47072.1 hypothetical protein BG262_01720 [Floricoccus penangensis]